MHVLKPAVLLVDPVKIGAGYKGAARDRGCAVISLYTVEPGELKKRWPEHGEDDDVSLYGTDPGVVLDELAALGFVVKAVVPGWESGTDLADVLAHALGVPGNDVTLALARRNKAAMRARAAEVGIRIPKFRLISSVGKVAEVADEIGYPVIVKPTTGAGSHGVTLVRDRGAARQLAAPETADLFGWPITEWLVEEYIRGRELAVNCFTADGEHRVADMWEYRQPDARDYDFPLWDIVQIGPDDPDWNEVETYVAEVLVAFGVRRGPSHTEVKCAPAGVHLMELGARLPGGYAADQWARYSDIRPFHDALDSYLGDRPGLIDRPPTFRAAYGSLAIRNDDRPGTLLAIHGLDELRTKPGVDKVLVSYAPGDHVPVTRDTTTIPVGAWVSGPDRAAVLRTLAEIRRLVVLDIEPDRPA